MTTERIHRRVCVAVLGAACGLALPCAAELVYYLPFDNGSTASLTNYGSVGGTATAESMTEWGGAPAPTASTAQIATNIGSLYSERFVRQGSNAGLVALPNSTNLFRLNNSSGRMTICTWVYWNGVYDSGIANAMPTSDDKGWSFKINSARQLYMLYKTATSGGIRRSTTLIPSNTWVHVAAQWDSSSNYALTLFVNGAVSGLDSSWTGSGVLNTTDHDVAVGNGNQSLLGGGYASLNGHLDDYAMWDTLLPAGKIRAIYTAPAVIPGFNIMIMNQLFTLHNAATGMTTITLGGKQKVWRYATGFTGHAAGDTWTDGAGAVYIQLDAANTGVKYVPTGTAMCLY